MSSVTTQVDGLSPRAARVYRELAGADRPLTRRELAARVGWSYPTARRATADLIDQELAQVDDPTVVPRRYALVAKFCKTGG